MNNWGDRSMVCNMLWRLWKLGIFADGGWDEVIIEIYRRGEDE